MALKEYLEKFLKDWGTEVTNEMRPDVPKASRELLQSIAPLAGVNERGNISLKLLMNSYWEEADLGTGPAKGGRIVSQRMIREWILVKPEVKAQVANKPGGLAKNLGPASFFIARKINKEGTKQPPSFFFSKTLGDLPFDPPSQRRREVTYPKGKGHFQELIDGIGKIFRDSIIKGIQ